MTHHYEAETPCETCSQGGCGKKHTIRVTDYNTSCMVRIETRVGDETVYDMTLTWGEATALKEMLDEAGL